MTHIGHSIQGKDLVTGLLARIYRSIERARLARVPSGWLVSMECDRCSTRSCSVEDLDSSRT